MKKNVEGLTNLLPSLTDEDNQAILSLGYSRFGFDWLSIRTQKTNLQSSTTSLESYSFH